MPHFVRDSSAWKEVKKRWVRDGGAWKEVKAAWVRDGGVWKQYFTAFNLQLSNRNVTSQVFTNNVVATSIAQITFYSDGRFSVNTSTADEAFITDEWGRPITSGVGAGYDVRLDVLSGSAPTEGPAVATWHAISSNRNWRLTLPNVLNGSDSGVWRLRIRQGSTTLADAEMDMTASVSNIGTS